MPIRPVSPIPDDPEHSGFQSKQNSGFNGDILPNSFSNLDPANVPGINPIPKNQNHLIKQCIMQSRHQPALYYAKSANYLVGPFAQLPTEDDLPSDEIYSVMKRQDALFSRMLPLSKNKFFIVYPLAEHFASCSLLKCKR